MLDNIKVFKQNSIKIDNIYFDPYGIDEYYSDAKYIFITHNHYDHFSIEDIDKVINENTIFIIPKSMKDEYTYSNKVICVEPNNEYKIDNIMFNTYHMYNINKPFHPKENNWCSYLLNYNDVNYLIIGDSDNTEDIRNKECNIAFVPIGSKFTMDVYEAIDYLDSIKYDYVIPVHYGSIIGDISLGNIIKDKLTDKCILKIK